MQAPGDRRSSMAAGAVICVGVLLTVVSGFGPAVGPWSAGAATRCLVVDDTDPAAESTRVEPCTVPVDAASTVPAAGGSSARTVTPWAGAGKVLLAGLVLTFGGLGVLVEDRRRRGPGSRPATVGEQTLLP